MGFDPESKQVTVKLWVRPNLYAPEDYTAWLFYNGERHDALWDDEIKALVAEPFARPAGETVKECRIVVESPDGRFSYQQSFLAAYGYDDYGYYRPSDTYRQIDNVTGLTAHRNDVFTGEGNMNAEGNTFRWRITYTLEQDSLPFGGKLASARVYAVDKETGEELFSQNIQGNKTSVDRSFRLTFGKSGLLLFGEAACEDGMRYRYYLGQVYEEYYHDRYGEESGPYFYFSGGNPPDVYFIHALFPDGSMVGLNTN